MTPQPQPKTRTRLARATLFLAIGAALAFVAMPASACPGCDDDAPGNGQDHHTICHATGSDSNPYVVISPSVEGVYNGHLGTGHQDGEDIIPPFTYNGTEYSQNWDAAGMAIFDADCEVEDSDTDTETSGSDTDTETSGSETETETSGSDTDTETSGSDTDTETSGSDTDTETEQVPVFGTATTLALGVGGALGGALLMLRRRL